MYPPAGPVTLMPGRAGKYPNGMKKGCIHREGFAKPWRCAWCHPPTVKEYTNRNGLTVHLKNKHLAELRAAEEAVGSRAVSGDSEMEPEPEPEPPQSPCSRPRNSQEEVQAPPSPDPDEVEDDAPLPEPFREEDYEGPCVRLESSKLDWIDGVESQHHDGRQDGTAEEAEEAAAAACIGEPYRNTSSCRPQQHLPPACICVSTVACMERNCIQRTHCICAVGGGGPDTWTAKKGTVAWYKERRHEPVYPGAQFTVEETCYHQLWARRVHHMTDAAFEDSLTYVRALICCDPDKNFHPPSRHIMEGVIGVQNWDKYEHHVCGNSKCPKGHAWVHTPRYKWQQLPEKHRKCPNCNADRFKLEMAGSGQSSEPVATVLYFGLAEVIQNRFFSNPEWCEKLVDPRDLMGTTGFWGSEEHLRMTSSVRALLQAALDADGQQQVVVPEDPVSPLPPSPPSSAGTSAMHSEVHSGFGMHVRPLS